MKTKIKNIAFSSMLVAVICIFSQISFVTPSIPFTLQTLAVALCGFMLSVKWSTACILTYIIIGAFGLPVFSAFRGGAQVLIGPTGGFIWGFIILIGVCSFATAVQKNTLKFIFCGIGLLFCHLLGVIQYSLLTSTNLLVSFLTASLPFILKDIVSVFAAFLLSDFIKKRIKGLKL